MRFVLLIVLFLSVCFQIPTASAQKCQSTNCRCGKSCAVRCRENSGWAIAETESFCVETLRGQREAEHVARHCETLRERITSVWNPKAAPWRLKCRIVIHPTFASYATAVGPGSEVSEGSSLVLPVSGEVTTRQVDLRADVPEVLTAALPHELCHVVLADLFRSQPPPLWFDEGVAILYDPLVKRQQHDADRIRAVQSGTAMTSRELMRLQGYPPIDRWAAFYGQSATLVQHLLELGTPQEVVQYIRDSTRAGSLKAFERSFGAESWGLLKLVDSPNAVRLLAPEKLSGGRPGVPGA